MWEHLKYLGQAVVKYDERQSSPTQRISRTMEATKQQLDKQELQIRFISKLYVEVVRASTFHVSQVVQGFHCARDFAKSGGLRRSLKDSGISEDVSWAKIEAT